MALLPYVTIVIHGRGAATESFVTRICETLRASLDHKELRKISFVWGTEPEPHDELNAAALALYHIVSGYREDQVSQGMNFGTTKADQQDRRAGLQRFMNERADQIDDAVLRLGVALDAARQPFRPSEKQVLWAMNVVGVKMTSTGHTLEDILPPAEYADLVRQLVAAVQNPKADNHYPDTGALIEAARAEGLRGAVYGDLVYEGRPLSDATPEALEAARAMIPEGTELIGFGPTGFMGVQADYRQADGKTGSSFQLLLVDQRLPHAPSEDMRQKAGRIIKET